MLKKIKVIALTFCLSASMIGAVSADEREVPATPLDKATVIESSKSTDDKKLPSYILAKTDDYTITMNTKFCYFLVTFNKEIEPKDYPSNIKISDENGDIPLISSTRATPGSKEVFLVNFYRGTFKAGKDYNMVIPANTIEFKDGTFYDKEINLDFTAIGEPTPKTPYDYFALSMRSNTLYYDNNVIVSNTDLYKSIGFNFTKDVSSLKVKRIKIETESTSVIEMPNPYIADNKDLYLSYEKQFKAGEKYKVTVPKESVTFEDDTNLEKDLIFTFEFEGIEPGFRYKTDVFNKEFYLEFNRETFIHEADKAIFKDSEGNEIEPSKILNSLNSNKRYIVYKFDNRFADGTYTLHIPEKSIRFRDRSFYEKPIDIEFKIANK